MLEDFIQNEQTADSSNHNDESYKFSTGDVSDYEDLLNEMQVPKQQFAKHDRPEESETEAAENQDETVPLTPRLKKEVAERTSKFIVNSADRIFSFSMDMYSGNENPGQYAASDDEKDEMIEAWKEVLKDSDKGVPPWLVAAATMLLIYACKFKEAHDYKAMKKALEQEQAENARKQQELDAIRKEMEELKRSNE